MSTVTQWERAQAIQFGEVVNAIGADLDPSMCISVGEVTTGPNCHKHVCT